LPILFSHVFLLAGIGILVVLFKGVYQYLPWILSEIAILVLCITWLFYKQMKNSESSIKKILSFPEYRDRTIEIKLLGGLVPFTMKPKEHTHTRIDHNSALNYTGNRLLADTIDKTEKKVIQLNALYEKIFLPKKNLKRISRVLLMDNQGA
jgi:hypothetical protein